MAESVVTHGEWTLVLRGLANINKPLYDTYTNKSLSHDKPLSPMYPIGCLRLDTNMSCDHHFRSKLLNEWPKLAQTELQVKFGIYKDGVMVKFLLFNGSNTTVNDWFSLENLINSSWTDLNSSNVKAFEIDGYGNRLFYIKYHSQDCDKDIGLLACVDNYDDLCPWGKPVPTFPRFLYSPGTTSFNYINMSRADVIAIFIKYKP